MLKYIFTVLLFSNIVHAECINSIAKSELTKSKANVPNAGLLTCKDLPDEPCFCFDGKDLRRWKAGFRPIDLRLSIDCNDEIDCNQKISSQIFNCDLSFGEAIKFDDKANWPSLDFTQLGRPAEGFFLWCEKEILVIDIDGSAAADIEDTAKAQEQNDRQTKGAARLVALKQCIQDLNSAPTKDQVENCLLGLIRQVIESEVNVSDL